MKGIKEDKSVWGSEDAKEERRKEVRSEEMTERIREGKLEELGEGRKVVRRKEDRRKVGKLVERTLKEWIELNEFNNIYLNTHDKNTVARNVKHIKVGMLRRGRNTGSLNALLVFTERFYLKRSFVRNVQAYTCDMTVLQSRNQYISAGLQRPKLWATLGRGSHTEIELIESSQLVKIFSMPFSSI